MYFSVVLKCFVPNGTMEIGRLGFCYRYAAPNGAFGRDIHVL